MPRSNRVVDNTSWSLTHDLRNYYLNAVVTYVDPDGFRWAANIADVQTAEDGGIRALIHRLGPEPGSGWQDRQWVLWDTLDLTLPRLGMVFVRDQWYFLQRQPARRMRKGYHHETIFVSALEGGYVDDEMNPLDPEAIRQIWYGNANRITNNIVQVQKRVYYTTELVAEFNDQGQAVLVPGKEKMGEMVCKALSVNNSELQVLRHPDHTQH